MKVLVLSAIVIIAGMTVADASKNEVLPVHPSKLAEYNARTGGLINPPSNAKSLVFLDARTERDPALDNQVSAAEIHLAFAIDLKKVELGADKDPRQYAFEARKAGAGAVVLVYERDGDPTLSTYPEDAVSLINVKALWADNPDRKMKSRRLMTEFWRAIYFAMGGYVMPGKTGGASMQSIYTLEDFDKLTGAGLSPVQISAIAGAKSQLGITSRRPVPYSRACREGWAPAPTNDAQKAVYEKYMNPASRFKAEYEKAQPKSSDGSK